MPVIKEQYSAIVTDTEDDKKRGRIKAKCVALTGSETTALPEWIDPTFDWGWFYVPDVGEAVEIEVVVQDDTAEGVPGQAFLEAPNYRWRNKRFHDPDGKQPRLPHDLFTSKNYGKRRGFATPLGHVFFFDDTEGDEQITLSWTNKAQDKFAYISFDKTGSALLSNQVGSMVHLDAENAETKIIDSNKNLIAMDANGARIIDFKGNIIDMKDGAISVLSQKAVVIQAATGCNIKSPKVMIDSGGDADQFLVRGDELKMWIDMTLKIWADTHVHPTAFGPSGPSIASLTAPPPTILSTDGKLK